ncbi:hypothetical protein [Ralstonia sp. A12]|uniref:hypothetical protein n=1 Tax=Ralstonia sp. A12 TaxID=1217052 RepID=UPI000694014F|nr:hypothetical protein [Ralstonia sp. A12]
MQPTQFEIGLPFEIEATWPSTNSLPAEVLERLLNGERLTQPKFGTSRWRLAAYIRRLKFLGWPVSATRVHYPGCKRPIAQYWLTHDFIVEVRALRELRKC